ncbi:hypothetical protein PILCRDRAFT_730567 [Piloderma croceum F 1598]|uniref:Uncharacterized protein n=1 Tax=Piloderma croceum (strain F 1598) TaxID=765440 RepID=A0A0C3F030_PILCF|nr:hypothetical protein PILCRDRAFT_730567 [Piloderma croceum F 1598]
MANTRIRSESCNSFSLCSEKMTVKVCNRDSVPTQESRCLYRVEPTQNGSDADAGLICKRDDYRQFRRSDTILWMIANDKKP